MSPVGTCGTSGSQTSIRYIFFSSGTSHLGCLDLMVSRWNRKVPHGSRREVPDGTEAPPRSHGFRSISPRNLEDFYSPLINTSPPPDGCVLALSKGPTLGNLFHFFKLSPAARSLADQNHWTPIFDG